MSSNSGLCLLKTCINFLLSECRSPCASCHRRKFSVISIWHDSLMYPGRATVTTIPDACILTPTNPPLFRLWSASSVVTDTRTALWHWVAPPGSPTHIQCSFLICLFLFHRFTENNIAKYFGN